MTRTPSKSLPRRTLIRDGLLLAGGPVLLLLLCQSLLMTARKRNPAGLVAEVVGYTARVPATPRPSLVFGSDPGADVPLVTGGPPRRVAILFPPADEKGSWRAAPAAAGENVEVLRPATADLRRITKSSV